MNLLLRSTTVVLAVLALATVTRPAHATLITGWGAETGFANGTVTDNGSGNLSTTAPTGNLGVRALLPSTISLANVNDGIELTGKVTSASAISGNQSFRFGLFNTNGHNQGSLSSGLWTGADPAGWFGYIVENGNSTGNTVTFGRNGSGTNAWLSTSGAAYNLNSLSPSGANAPASIPVSFDLLIYRTSATAVNIAFTFTNVPDGGTYTQQNLTIVDNGGLSAAIAATSFNAVGFLENGSSGGAMTYSNVDVTAVTVPEPSALILLGLGCLGLVGSIARRR